MDGVPLATRLASKVCTNWRTSMSVKKRLKPRFLNLFNACRKRGVEMLENRRIRLGSGFAFALAILLASTSMVQAQNYWTLGSGSATWATGNWKCWGG